MFSITHTKSLVIKSLNFCITKLYKIDFIRLKDFIRPDEGNEVFFFCFLSVTTKGEEKKKKGQSKRMATG